MNAPSGTDLRLSRLMLGTAQFGQAYGVANRSGQPSFEQVLAILSAAFEGGVNCLDTAAAYGASEEVLGRALHELRAVDRVCVVTKVRPLTAEELADSHCAARAIELSVDESRRRLRLDRLPIVLFHRECDAAHGRVLSELRDRGWVRWAGVSCDNQPDFAVSCLNDPAWTALQVPANVLDRRHIRVGVPREAAARGKAVFVRSVYLQGLLLMPESDLPIALRQVIPVRDALSVLAAEGGMGLSELAMRFMLAQEGVTCVLAGVETVAQVRDNVAIVARGPLPADMVAAIDKVVPELPSSVLTPAHWSALADQYRSVEERNTDDK
jgi:aryl-alcohol dehydrogenase-like predicted oxidoreductase